MSDITPCVFLVGGGPRLPHPPGDPADPLARLLRIIGGPATLHVNSSRLDEAPVELDLVLQVSQEDTSRPLRGAVETETLELLERLVPGLTTESRLLVRSLALRLDDAYPTERPFDLRRLALLAVNHAGHRATVPRHETFVIDAAARRHPAFLGLDFAHLDDALRPPDASTGHAAIELEAETAEAETVVAAWSRGPSVGPAPGSPRLRLLRIAEDAFATMHAKPPHYVPGDPSVRLNVLFASAVQADYAAAEFGAVMLRMGLKPASSAPVGGDARAFVSDEHPGWALHVHRTSRRTHHWCMAWANPVRYACFDPQPDPPGRSG